MGIFHIRFGNFAREPNHREPVQVDFRPRFGIRAEGKGEVAESLRERIAPVALGQIGEEDLCQALGSPIGIKYESDGGPGMVEILDLLLGAKDSAQDRYRFFKSQILFWLLCAPDGHARNFSVSIGQGGTFSLTPLYDVISAYPILGHGKNKLAPEKVKLAMAVQGKHKHRHWNRIRPPHWAQAARMAGLGTVVEQILAEISGQAEKIANRIASRLPSGFPASVAEPVLEGIMREAGKLKEQSPLPDTP